MINYFTSSTYVLYHPLSLKKDQYNHTRKAKETRLPSPSGYLIFVLLQIFTKILAKVTSLRFAKIATAIGLIHAQQCGSVTGFSTTDSVTTVIYKTNAMQLAKLRASIPFLDNKEDFNHVLKQILTLLPTTKAIPP